MFVFKMRVTKKLEFSCKDYLESVHKLECLAKKFESKACENFKPQNTSVFEDLKFEQQRRYRTL